MGKITGFLEFARAPFKKRSVAERVKDFKEFEESYDLEALKIQGARCMDCGIPFCQGETGCPVDNLIPEFNDLVYKGRMKEAWENLQSTNNFPEFTGRLCPAPCESACTLGLIKDPVSIKGIERSIIDNAWENNWVVPRIAESRSGKKIAIIGSGPAGLSAAQQLARAGHDVTVFEKNDRIGGLLRYGIPDFKFEKTHIDKRIEQMQKEGVTFKTNVNVGIDISAKSLYADFDSIVLAMGSETPRDLKVDGRNLKGIYFAMDFLTRSNRSVAGDKVSNFISAKDKNVVVIGGGDTGSDCVGTSNRHGAKSITQIEIFSEPPKDRDPSTPWPLYPKIFRTSTSHEEGVSRKWSINTLGFKGNSAGEVTAIVGTQVELKDGKFVAIPKTEFEWPADLVFLAMGFTGPVRSGLIEDLQKMGMELDSYGNVKANFGLKEGSFATTLEKVYACGDVRRGQSLIVWAISEGRKCAEQVHRYLQRKI